MKKIALSVLAFLMAQGAFAHTFKDLNSLTNAAADRFFRVAQGIERQETRWNRTGAYRVTEIQPARKPGESAEDLYIRILKSVLHRDAPITGDDGGYDVGALKSAQDVKAALRDTNFEEARALEAALNQAIEKKLIVLSGTGSGNNTSANYVAVADPRTQEIVYLLNSNFGSDD